MDKCGSHTPISTASLESLTLVSKPHGPLSRIPVASSEAQFLALKANVKFAPIIHRRFVSHTLRTVLGQEVTPNKIPTYSNTRDL